MKQEYIPQNFRAKSLKLIEIMNEIIRSYRAQGDILTVRQLYYQMVARGHIENTEKSYKATTDLVNNARLGGLMDWDAIEDRTRSFIRRHRWNSPEEILKASADSYHEDMWNNQEQRIFVIVEKEALAGVLERPCRRFDVPLLAARGYPSSTVVREFVLSDIRPALDEDQSVIILHLGDHDPSGIDMTRDLTERIALFAEIDTDRIDLMRIALTMDQIRSQNPPPNPAKSTDSRFQEYRERFGSSSWELDALTPTFLRSLVEQNIRENMDPEKWQERQDEVQEIRDKIESLGSRFGEDEDD